MQSNPRAVHSDGAPAAIGPYSQAVVCGELVFCSGQVALDPSTMQLVEGDVTVQAARALDNLRAVLAAAGCGMDRVVKTTVYLLTMDDFAAVNAVYARYFPGESKPARATVAVRELPKAARVEIDCIAHLG